MDGLVYPCKLCLNLSRKGVYKREVITRKGGILGRTERKMCAGGTLIGRNKKDAQNRNAGQRHCATLYEKFSFPQFKNIMSHFNPANCPPTQWGIQAIHIPTSYKELQRNKVLFSQLPFPASLLQPHWTSSTNSHL